jgi:hypothetical protein
MKKDIVGASAGFDEHGASAMGHEVLSARANVSEPRFSEVEGLAGGIFDRIPRKPAALVKAQNPLDAP